MKECRLCNDSFHVLNERDLCSDCSVFSDEQITKTILLRDINRRKDDLEYTQTNFLRKFGWQNSSDFPDCTWRWVKEIKGQTIAVSLEHAIRIESCIQHYKEKEK